MRVWWWLCKEWLVKAVASYTFLTILAPVSEIPNGLTARIRRMSFLLQRLPEAAKAAGNETSHSTQMPWLQLIRWEGGQDPAQHLNGDGWRGLESQEARSASRSGKLLKNTTTKLLMGNVFTVI